MSVADELERLKSAARDFESEADFDFVDPKQLAAVIDRLQGALCKVVDWARKRGDHLPDVADGGRRPALRRRAARPSAPDRGRLELRPDRLPGDRGHLPPQRAGGREA